MSDVFDEYVKIMTEKGFVKKADVMTYDDKEKDSDYAEKIKALYGVDIDTNGSSKNIIDQAHPEKAIVAPSYDKLNGLVENINERHNIMVGIVNRKPSGNLTQHRYAQKELLDEIIRLGFDLDCEGEEELSKMADMCANDFVKEAFKKEAFLPAWFAGVAAAAPWVIKGVAAITTIGWVKTQIIGHISQGIKPDAEKAITALQDLKNEVDKSNYGILDKWISVLQLIYNNAEKAESIAGNTENQDVSNMDISAFELDTSSKIKGTKEDLVLLNKFKNMCVYVASKIGKGTASKMVNDPTGITDATGLIGEIHKMTLTEDEATSDAWQWAKGLWGTTFGNTKTNAVHSVAALRNSLSQFVAKLNSSTSQGSQMASRKEQDILAQIGDVSEYVQEE